MRSLGERLAHVAQIGRVTWLGLRPEHDAPMEVIPLAKCIAAHGVEGDVASRGRPGGKRQITLIQAEHLPVIASFLDGAEVILVGTGACAPCSKMDANIAEGAFQAMRGHGGITAQIERGGVIRVGDRVQVVPPE